MTAHHAVGDGKLTNEELGSFTRRCDEIKRRLNEGTLSLPLVMSSLQTIIEDRSLKTQHVIDLDADPFIPSGWKVEEHQKGGQFTWDAAKVALFLAEGQENGKYIKGNKLREELKDHNPYNANLLDYLLKHPHLIPEEWKSEYVFFWGTIYCYSDGSLCVRCLCWVSGRWHWFCHWLDRDWRDDGPAAVLAR